MGLFDSPEQTKDVFKKQPTFKWLNTVEKNHFVKNIDSNVKTQFVK